MGATIRVIIGDAHETERVTLFRLLTSQPDFDVIAVTDDGEDALALLRHHRPQLAILDEDLPSFGGCAVARIISRELPDVSVVVTHAS